MGGAPPHPHNCHETTSTPLAFLACLLPTETMARMSRQSTTPMDFEWSNRTGPIDAQSPFLAGQQQQQQKKRKMADRAASFGEEQQLLTSGFAFAGPHSVLESPSKHGFATPNRLRDPDNRMTYFNRDPSKPLPSTPASSVPAHVQENAWSMRTPSRDLDFSSGGETPGTPYMDSDVATPDTQLASRMGRLGNGEGDKKATRRDSWLKRTFGGSSSPTKERDKERDKESSSPQKYYSRKAENRIVKRRSERSRSKKRVHMREDDHDHDSDSDLATRPSIPTTDMASPVPPPPTFTMNLAGFLSWVEAHPNLPTVMSYYLQLGVNMLLGGGFIYLIYLAWAGVMTDVDIESSKHASEVMVEIAACALEYNRNRCRPEEVVPAMEKACGVWETCMSRDPKKVARATVTAKTFAMIFNSFVEEFSYKSMVCFVLVFCVLWVRFGGAAFLGRELWERGGWGKTACLFTAIVIFGGFNLSNWAFGLLRSSQQQQHHQQTHQHQHHDFPPPPQTPQQHRITSNSNGYQDTPSYQQNVNYNHQAYQQNWQQQYREQTPYPQQQQRHIEAPPPPLVHANSMPALSGSGSLQDGGGGAEAVKGTRRRGLLFR
ncbi:nuclear envelope brr6 [Pyrenophora seminiperda CCB06]|uniref:Nuclear envelope brr6 n=1 Tax=Pyrenophora seminiperda CCB06 TaxID=1302712 RepID=A0A3M7MB97_9PLEO|nr:nuclear envelope brr6 [Pyrenophora seminiperda CCB06]